MKALYLSLHLFTISFPLIRSFEPRLHYAFKWKALFPAIFITATFFIIWDALFTRMDVWGFNEAYILGIKFFSLPIEEWLFFITVPFASVFIYESVYFFLPDIQSNLSTKLFSGAIAITLITISIINADKAYTHWSFLFASIFLVFVLMTNAPWLGKFWIAYFIHLLPFILVNGVLTGSFIQEPVVKYNNNQNLGIRLFTIPIEDTVYALLLLLMNITFYEYFLTRFKIRT